MYPRHPRKLTGSRTISAIHAAFRARRSLGSAAHDTYETDRRISEDEEPSLYKEHLTTDAGVLPDHRAW